MPLVLDELLPDMRCNTCALIIGVPCTGKTSMAMRLAREAGMRYGSPSMFVCAESPIQRTRESMQRTPLFELPDELEPILVDYDLDEPMRFPGLDSADRSPIVIDYIQRLWRPERQEYNPYALHDLPKMVRDIKRALRFRDRPLILVSTLARDSEPKGAAGFSLELGFELTDLIFLQESWYPHSVAGRSEKWHDTVVDVWNQKAYGSQRIPLQFKPSLLTWRTPDDGIA